MTHDFRASTDVSTENGSRYMKALCNHFDRKASASYEGDHGRATFPFGSCEMEVRPDGLSIRAAAPSAELLDRVKYVISDHLIRFGAKESLTVEWQEG